MKLRAAFLIISLGAFLSTIAIARADPARELTDIDPATSKAYIEGEEELRRLVVVTRTPKGTVRQEFVLDRLPKGTPLFHWTSAENQNRWLAQGGQIDEGEIKFLATPSGDRQVHGPGLYLSDNPLDSKSFGEKAVVATMPDDITIIRGKVKPTTPEQAARTFQRLRELGIFGTQVTDTWFTMFDKWPASRLAPLTLDSALDALSKPGAKPISAAMVGQLIEAFGLQPHPFFDKQYPALAKAMRKEPLRAAEVKKIQKDFFSYFDGEKTQKAIWQHLSDPSRVEIMKAAASPKDNYFSSLITVETKLGLPPLADLKPVYPGLARILSDEAIPTAERAKLFSQFDSLLYDAPAPGSGIAKKIGEKFAPEIRRHFVDQVMLPDAYSLESNVRTARGWGVPLSAIAENSKDPGRYPATVVGELKDLTADLKDFGKRFLNAYQFIGEADLTVAAAQGNSQPWARYDDGGPSLEDRWNKALALADDTGDLDRVSALAGKPMKFRDHPITAGGDIFLPGEKDGYFRATADEVEALRANPFLNVYAVRDPWPQTEAFETKLVRYDYASPGHFEQFAEHLPEELLADLKAARLAGDLADVTSETYRDLTRRMLEHLTGNMEKGAETPLAKYVRRISVHPFDDLNGRFARLAYVKETNEPLSMRHWNLDILTTPAEIAAFRDEGRTQHLARAADLKAMELRDPNFPRYYDAPELYDGLFHSPVPLGDPTVHQQANRDFFRNPEHIEMIRKKEIAQLEWRAWDSEIDRLLALPTAERDAALLTWARSNLRPEPRTRVRFEAFLKATQEAAEREGIAADLMPKWWFDLASGSNAAYAESMAQYLRSLKSPLRERFLAERLSNRLQPKIALGDALENDTRALAEARLQGPAGQARQDAAVFLLDRGGEPGERKALALRFAKDPEIDPIFRRYLNQPSLPSRREAVATLMELPRNTLSKESRNQLLVAISNLPTTEQPDILVKLLQHPDHWLVSDAWKMITYMSEGEEGGGSLSSALQDKRIQAKLLERIRRAPKESRRLANITYILGDDGMAEQLKIYQAMQKAKAWDTFAGMLGSQLESLAYLKNHESDEAGSGAEKLRKYLMKELPKLATTSPEYASLYNLAISNLVDARDEKEMYARKALDHLSDAKFGTRRNLIEGFLTITRAAEEEGPGALFTVHDVLKAAVRGGPDTTRNFFSKLRKKEYIHLASPFEDAAEAAKADQEVAAMLLESLKRMKDSDRLGILNRLTSSRQTFGREVVATILKGGHPEARASLLKLLAEPNYAGERWSTLRNAATEMNPRDQQPAVRAFLRARGGGIPSEEQTKIILAAIHEFPQGVPAEKVFGKKALALPLAQRLALLAESDASLPRKERVGDSVKLQDLVRAELKKGDPNTLLEALAFADKKDPAAWRVIGAALAKLTDETKPSAAEAISLLNRSVSADGKIGGEAATELLALAPKLKVGESFALMELLGKTRDVNPRVIDYLGRLLLANDPAVSDAATRALAALSLREAGGRDLLMPILKEYVERKGGAREKLAPLFRRAGIDYAKDIAPLEKARELSRGLAGGKQVPCAEWFKGWAI